VNLNADGSLGIMGAAAQIKANAIVIGTSNGRLVFLNGNVSLSKLSPGGIRIASAEDVTSPDLQLTPQEISAITAKSLSLSADRANLNADLDMTGNVNEFAALATERTFVSDSAVITAKDQLTETGGGVGRPCSSSRGRRRHPSAFGKRCNKCGFRSDRGGT
jgi:hypothetical protein